MDGSDKPRCPPHENTATRTSSKDVGPDRHWIAVTTCEDCDAIVGVETHTDRDVNN